MPTLADLRPGDRADVLALSGAPALVQRLYELGLFEGECVELLAVAPLGDPLELEVRGGRISIRRRDAAAVELEP